MSRKVYANKFNVSTDYYAAIYFFNSASAFLQLLMHTKYSNGSNKVNKIAMMLKERNIILERTKEMSEKKSDAELSFKQLFIFEGQRLYFMPYMPVKTPDRAPIMPHSIAMTNPKKGMVPISIMAIIKSTAKNINDIVPAMSIRKPVRLNKKEPL